LPLISGRLRSSSYCRLPRPWRDGPLSDIAHRWRSRVVVKTNQLAQIGTYRAGVVRSTEVSQIVMVLTAKATIVAIART
jgi:hypothetical protein